MMDPPREEVSRALEVAREAGIRTLMITGDAPETALAVAHRIGLGAARALTGREIARLDDEALRDALADDVVFARSAPRDKLRIVTLLQEDGEVVGMTGDGVNDAPALKKADIGIAMGIRGTDVAKSAADMVLTDDNYASIVSAVEEGRRQYANIRKFVRYLLSSNTGEILAILVNILAGGPLILLPVQILWMNFITDGLTAVALGVERAEPDGMKRAPYGAGEPILDRVGLGIVLVLGAYVAAATLALFYGYRQWGGPTGGIVAQTVAFTTIIVVQKFNVLNFRSLTAPMRTVGLFSNPWLGLALVLNLGLHLAVLYLPVMQRAFHTAPLGWSHWGMILLVAAPVFVVPELVKWQRYRRGQRMCS
jgi:Ca2+-transporting ATPase